MINLHEIGRAHGYRCKWDESRESHYSKDPWMMILPGSYGQIYVHGKEQLAFATTKQRARKLRNQIPGVVFLQNGDDGINATFPTEELGKVAKMLHLYRKKVFSEEYKARLRDRMALLHEERLNKSIKTDPETHAGPSDDQSIEE